MPAHRIQWSWSPSSQEKRAEAARSLSERLREGSLDRCATSRAVAQEAARSIQDWLEERPKGWGRGSAALDEAGSHLEAGWADWMANQGWRGICARLIEDLRLRFHAAREHESAELRIVLAEVLELWTGVEGARREFNDPANVRTEAGPVSHEAVVPHALRSLERSETVLLYGYSETVLASLAAAQRAGLFPEVVIGLGAGDESGKRMARGLAAHGVSARLLWDAAAIAAVPHVDRVWLGTEALGSTSFVGLVGTTLLLAEAQRHEVPVSLLCTSDKLISASQVELPRWGSEERWNLWSHGPEEVQVESQPFELSNTQGVQHWITEQGPESLADLCTRSLRTDVVAPCVEQRASHERSGQEIANLEQH